MCAAFDVYSHHFADDLCRSHSRSRSRSNSASSFEDDYGVKKETLLHGSYADYVKEYKSRSGGGETSRSSGRSQEQSQSRVKALPSIAQIASAYQKALSHVAAAIQQQQGASSSKVCVHCTCLLVHTCLRMYIV